MPKGYSKSETSVHFMNYHFVWCPKYRKKLIVSDVEKRLKHLIEEKATELECSIIALETMPDHVHLFVRAPPVLAPNQIVGKIKGHSSRILRKEFAHLRTRLPTLWSRSYFVSTHDRVSAKIIKEYVEGQKTK